MGTPHVEDLPGDFLADDARLPARGPAGRSRKYAILFKQ
jgi:hypothetical protein